MSHFNPVSIGCTGLPFASTSLAFLHFGYPVQARNGPRLPSRITIGLPHFSQMCSVGFAVSTGLPSASKFIFVWQPGKPLQPRKSPRGPVRCSIGLPQVGHLYSVSIGSGRGASPSTGLM